MYFEKRQLPSTPEKFFDVLQRGYDKIAESNDLKSQPLWTTITEQIDAVRLGWEDEQFKAFWVQHLVDKTSCMVWNAAMQNTKNEKQANRVAEAFERLYK